MEKGTMVTDSRMYSYVVLLDMHTGFFRSALEGISDGDAQRRLDTKANHIAWLAGSLVQQRYEMAHALGLDAGLQQAAHELFKDNKGIQDGLAYPSLSSFLQDWDVITPKLREAMLKADAGQLDHSVEFMPGHKATILELTSFSIYREANCIGQIALWRRLLGYDAMKYM
ncbi:hypothetical protein [Taibaiella chishuiensis]|nr:hypothetical protein [Taibaiella chishuiensis]